MTTTAAAAVAGGLDGVGDGRQAGVLEGHGRLADFEQSREVHVVRPLGQRQQPKLFTVEGRIFAWHVGYTFVCLVALGRTSTGTSSRSSREALSEDMPLRAHHKR